MWEYIDFDAELYHHGVKGMKWGVRRSPEQLGYPAPKKRKKPVSAYVKKVGNVAGKGANAVGRGVGKAGKATGHAISSTGKKIHDARNERLIREGDAKKIYKKRGRLDDRELTRAVKRVNDDQRLKDVAQLNQSPASRFVKKGSLSIAHTLENSGTKVLGAAAAGAISYVGYKYIKKNHPEFAPHMFPGPAKVDRNNSNKNSKKLIYEGQAKTYINKALKKKGSSRSKKVVSSTRYSRL